MTSDRYLRQRILPEIGEEGQQRLAQARVLIAGCGALGTNLADLIARAGVGQITVVDHDRVELGNLQRQALMGEADLGRPKAQAVAKALTAINSESEVSYEVTK
ncbi:ThiF family adenylyltransferase, partial [Candidatus Bipolaricaulota bacterium]|nr:ThiF family adenylyltransferase [Candidatus Bipolaricaulota bacterium]